MYNKNNSKVVVNITGTGVKGSRYKIPNLRKKFIKAGGTASTKCQVKGCGNDGSATAHIRHDDKRRRDNNWYLCWVCAAHNHPENTSPYPLRKNAVLVPVADVRN